MRLEVQAPQEKRQNHGGNRSSFPSLQWRPPFCKAHWDRSRSKPRPSHLDTLPFQYRNSRTIYAERHRSLHDDTSLTFPAWWATHRQCCVSEGAPDVAGRLSDVQQCGCVSWRDFSFLIPIRGRWGSFQRTQPAPSLAFLRGSQGRSGGKNKSSIHNGLRPEA